MSQKKMLHLPIYRNVYLVLRSKIHDGQFQPGTLLPTEVELAREFGCSRVTIRKALELLVGDGLVMRRQGHGTVVAPNAPAEPVRSAAGGFIRNLKAMGLQSKVEVLHFAFEVPPARIQEILGLPAGVSALHAIRLRSVGDKPLAYSVTWLPETISQNISRSDLASKSITELLYEAGVGKCQARQRVFATAADATIAPLLGLEVASPLLGIERLVQDASNQIVELLRVFYHPDRYEFEITMHADLSDPHVEWRALNA